MSQTGCAAQNHGFAPYPKSRSARGCTSLEQPFSFRPTHHHIEILYARARGAFAEIVEYGHDARLLPRLIAKDIQLKPIAVLQFFGVERFFGSRLLKGRNFDELFAIIAVGKRRMHLLHGRTAW